MKLFPIIVFVSAFVQGSPAQTSVSKDLVFAEKKGVVAIEAEHFTKQERADVRAWYLTTRDQEPKVKPDGDPSHIAGAAGGAYLELLPDTRRSHGDRLIPGENFTEKMGTMAVLSYPVHFETPGTYWIWARVCSTTSEDNGLHFGINGTWPQSARRWQTIVKNQWHWKSAQRTEKVHVGVDGILTLEVPSAGVHTIQVSMREDGISLDKILLANRKDYQPEGLGPKPMAYQGEFPKPFPFVKAKPAVVGSSPSKKAPVQKLRMRAEEFPLTDSAFYLDQGKWAAVNPEKHQAAVVATSFPYPGGRYDLAIEAVGEDDGGCTYTVAVNDAVVGIHTAPLAQKRFQEGPRFHGVFKGIELNTGDVIRVAAVVASADGKEYSRARWSALSFLAADSTTRQAVSKLALAQSKQATKKPVGPPLQLPRQADGDGSVSITGEQKQWHAVAIDFAGPYAHELDREPNPFTDYRLDVTFTHESGRLITVPGFFAADGHAAESSAESGTTWRVHFCPPLTGQWSYEASFLSGPQVALDLGREGGQKAPLHGKKGELSIAASDKQWPDFRERGRLTYVGKHLLRFQGDHSYFLKAGADAPETLLAYTDFDNTQTLKAKKGPLKTWAAHEQDWQAGDPTWQNGKGKGLIGALNYLAAEGLNAFSFLPYNVDGDGSNVWPFVHPREKFHYDCSKLAQWDIVFDHAMTKGLFLHFKMQETEIDDHRLGHKKQGGEVSSSLDGGKLGPERKLYCRELIARFGHHLALNWNLGEENTQTTEEQLAMADYIKQLDGYQNHVVIHTFPDQQDRVYNPLLGRKEFTGISLQNSSLKGCHHQVVNWVRKSRASGRPWVVAFDEPGDAQVGMPPDPDYPGMPADYDGPTIDDCRKYTLWGTLMAGGTGVEYYFGYKLPENDLVCEDWRSRDRSWDYCRYALNFFREQQIPVETMNNRNDLIGNKKNDNSKYCLAKEGELYLVYLPTGGQTDVRLPKGEFTLSWFNPRTGELGDTASCQIPLQAPDQEDWLAVIRKK